MDDLRESEEYRFAVATYRYLKATGQKTHTPNAESDFVKRGIACGITFEELSDVWDEAKKKGADEARTVKL